MVAVRGRGRAIILQRRKRIAILRKRKIKLKKRIIKHRRKTSLRTLTQEKENPR